jgi:PKD domain
MTKTITCFVLLLSLLTTVGCYKKDVNHPKNKVPIADAGASDTVVLTKQNTELKGSGYDKDGEVVAYLWSQVSGPEAATIVNPGSPTTKVEFRTTGSYVFQLMVTDNDGATGVDTVSISVKPTSEQTLTFQPTNNPYEYNVTSFNGQDLTGTTPEISIDAWTSSGAQWYLREVFKFDKLSTIPANATIKSAHLFLYSNPKPKTGNQVDANFGTDNALLLEQVTSDWSPSTIGWYNQPTTSTTNQITIPTTSQSFEDLDIDVTDMVSSMVNNSANYGFRLKLVDEVIYNSRIFVSSHNTDYPHKHPKLVVTYE